MKGDERRQAGEHRGIGLGRIFAFAAVVAATGCDGQAQHQYDQCVNLETGGQYALALRACEEAIRLGPNSEPGKAAATKIDDLKAKIDAKDKADAARKEEEEAKRKRKAEEENAKARTELLANSGRCTDDMHLPTCERMCELDIPKGCNRAGYIRSEGVGVAKDMRMAWEYYKKDNRLRCEKENDSGACEFLGDAFRRPGIWEQVGVKEDLAVARKYYDAGCRLGGERSCYRLKQISNPE